MRKTKPPYPSYADRRSRAKTRPHAVHEKHPAGAKAILRFYKAHHGTHASTVAEARTWYAKLHADKVAAVEKRDAERKAQRIARNHPWLANRIAA